MERNEMDAAFAEKHADDIERVNSIEKLNQAAEIFEAMGRTALAQQATELLLRIAQPTKPAPGVSPEEREAAQRGEQPEISEMDLAIARARDMLDLARESFADHPEAIGAIEEHYKRIGRPGRSDQDLLRDLQTFTDILAATISESYDEDVAYAKDKKAKSTLDKLNEVFGMFGFKLTEKDVKKLK
jgi:hypothetical protein